MFKKSLLLAATAMAFALPASASLYTGSYGTQIPTLSDCDDCYVGEVSFGAGQNMAFFGTTYDGLYISSNGYVTFGAGADNYSPQALDTQTVGKMIAGLFTDLDSRSDAPSNVYYDNSTLGQLVITWQDMGHWSVNYGLRSTFQLVVRSDQYAIASGEGQIGFFYDVIGDGNIASAGFGDGLAAVNPGEVAFASQVTASSLSNSAARWYNLAGSTPVEATVPEPGSLALVGAALLGLCTLRRRNTVA